MRNYERKPKRIKRIIPIPECELNYEYKIIENSYGRILKWVCYERHLCTDVEIEIDGKTGIVLSIFVLTENGYRLPINRLDADAQQKIIDYVKSYFDD